MIEAGLGLLAVFTFRRRWWVCAYLRANECLQSEDEQRCRHAGKHELLDHPMLLAKVLWSLCEDFAYLGPYNDIWDNTCFWCNHSVNAFTPISGVKSCVT